MYANKPDTHTSHNINAEREGGREGGRGRERERERERGKGVAYSTQMKHPPTHPHIHAHEGEAERQHVRSVCLSMPDLSLARTLSA